MSALVLMLEGFRTSSLRASRKKQKAPKPRFKKETPDSHNARYMAQRFGSDNYWLLNFRVFRRADGVVPPP